MRINAHTTTNTLPRTFKAPARVAPETVEQPLDGSSDSVLTQQDQDWTDAGKLMAERGIPAKNHELFQENLATYLAHRIKGIPNQRWQNKIDRELSSPYTNEQVYNHIETLEQSLQDNLLELPALPSKIYITGSFAKGRLGANSDLDGFAVMPKHHMGAGFDSYEKREKNETGSNLFPLSENSPGYNKGHLMFAGQSVTLSPKQVLKDGFLRRAYEQIQSRREGNRRETSSSFEKITATLWGEDKTAAQKREAFESQSFRTRVQNSIMSLGGTLSMTPLVGPVINKVCDLFCKQVHHDLTELGQEQMGVRFSKDQDWKDAGKLMQERGIPSADHRLMQENLATYLAHRVDGQDFPTGRWETKIQRELDKPYTDTQVHSRIDRLQNSLLENLRQLPEYPGQITLTGSFSKGRLGANSNLDGYVKVAKEDFQSGLVLFGERHTRAKGANLFPSSQASPNFNKGMLLVEGTSQQIDTERLEEEGYLNRVYSQNLENSDRSRKETSPKLDGLTGKMWRSKFERDPLHFKAMRGLVASVGMLSSLPLLGPLVQMGVERLIAQDHRGA